ncbi:MAG: 50S ribosomal protein L14 [Candidatus Harrisonbacteria bacterium CG10_big_fil_rev_8_21_14_0_10_45_28]|uniref:Large ribosomal subunit protein uL14 n=1 Tax=Candidatus Harrisonbacteria bacterium CG10_big_fil_rev_8_21_14_0_10_45_28 TaxID=1974586 RepID=A0A2H0UNV7_9BACT|nr:MAG: 50S ribosomal protein L14 [Candidatus Harrisonbacteria bacterium CG10_big_fil_rev_8_21_14_0_10_45_28]
MLQLRSLVKVADNSGAKTVRVFTVLGGSRKRYAQIGELVVASVQTADPKHMNKMVKKRDVVRCVVVRQRHPIRRRDGSVLRFDENAVVIVDEKKQPKATRIFGPIPRELKEKGFDSIFSMAEEVV